jgi:hypothetical protein
VKTLVDRLMSERRAAVERAETAERELSNTASLLQWQSLQDECATLRAEVERLTAETWIHLERAEAAEASLAAAAELLVRLQGSGLLRVGSRLRTAVDAFLAAQPAAPEYRCGSCRDTGKWSNGIVCPVCQPAAPACGACPDIAECNNSGCRGCADGGPAAPAVRAPNPEAVARILADPDCAAPARRPDTRESSLFDSTGKPAAPTQKDTQ